MTTQPEALRIAEGLENYPVTYSSYAAAELRRLHEENLILTDSVQAKADRIDRLGKTVERLHVVNQELVKALKRIDQALQIPAAEYVPAISDVFKMIDAAINKATGEQT